MYVLDLSFFNKKILSRLVCQICRKHFNMHWRQEARPGRQKCSNR